MLWQLTNVRFISGNRSCGSALSRRRVATAYPSSGGVWCIGGRTKNIVLLYPPSSCRRAYRPQSASRRWRAEDPRSIFRGNHHNNNNIIYYFRVLASCSFVRSEGFFFVSSPWWANLLPAIDSRLIQLSPIPTRPRASKKHSLTDSRPRPTLYNTRLT